MIACKIDADEKVLRLCTSTPLPWRYDFVGIVTTSAHVGDMNETAETELSAVSEVGKLGKDGFGQKCLGILCNLL
jgi:hypothetical protein